MSDTESGEGRDALWCWFGLSRASFLVVPRVLMHEMPDEWQAKMAELLKEYEDTFSEWPDWTPIVQLRENGKFVPMPDWLKDYRHPDENAINSLRPKMSKTG